ncbi:TIGR01459 family HAD-type hydrolase [Rhizobium sp. P32RR-XVIII]|uniref:TIGR01459 family HAD-type hydrolase n=1 Tax=Rhizobium sp. P32RR-XVIII TaxID=2726738 RepID=UPI001456ADCD|nr:TIGR01459 family HAD-type hydrolase [Rhizobium sp. P32RR-XVIII]NLS07144.1 TIGR01459 family HAD-type hydrolase [Rhizobium sp. P32RR-XVIII]
MTIAPEISLAALIDRYDYFLIDQFGVLRDDDAYDGAVAALRRLKEAGKHVIVLSNSGRSGDYNAERFARLGFDRQLFERFVTSGDVAFNLLSADPNIRPGMRAFTISSGGDQNLADRLGLVSVAQSDEADLVIISGSEAERIELEIYRRRLAPAAANNAPCVCTNPDIHKLAGGKIAPGAGAIARIYENLGGMVHWIGKPHREIYEFAMAQWASVDPAKIVCIGDSIEHDIKGASDMGLSSVLVRTGILADASEQELSELMQHFAGVPTYMMSSFSPDTTAL